MLGSVSQKQLQTRMDRVSECYCLFSENLPVICGFLYFGSKFAVKQSIVGCCHDKIFIFLY